MLVCACNVITASEIRAAITALLNEDRWQLIVPAKVYHHLGKRGRCCDCFEDVYGLIVETTAHFHAALSTDEAEIGLIIARLRDWQDSQKNRQNPTKPPNMDR